MTLYGHFKPCDKCGELLCPANTNTLHKKIKCDTCGKQFCTSEQHELECNHITCEKCGEEYCTLHEGHPNVCCESLCGPKITCECGHTGCSKHDDHFIYCSRCGEHYCTDALHVITCIECHGEYCLGKSHVCILNVDHARI